MLLFKYRRVPKIASPEARKKFNREACFAQDIDMSLYTQNRLAAGADFLLLRPQGGENDLLFLLSPVLDVLSFVYSFMWICNFECSWPWDPGLVTRRE